MLRTKVVLVFAILLCNSYEMFSQEIIREGYIIKNNGEYFEGLIRYSSGNRMPEKCIFKSFDIAFPITYTADILKTFGFKNGQRFESIGVGTKRMFYEIIVYGSLTLFKSNSGYHIRKDGFEILDLNSGELKWVDEQGEKLFDNREELMTFLADGIDTKKNSEDRIIDAVISYNSRSGSDFVSYKRNLTDREVAMNAVHTDRRGIQKGIIAGFSQYSLSLELTRKGYCPLPEIERALTFGLNFEKVLSRKNDKLSLRSDVLFLKQTFYTYQEITLPDMRTSIDDSFFEFASIKLPVLIQYSFAGMKARPFINAGFAASGFINSDYLHINEKETFDHKSIYTTVDKNFHLRSGELSVCAGGGIKLKFAQDMLIHLEARIEAGSGLFKKDVHPNNTVKQYSVQTGFFTTITF